MYQPDTRTQQLLQQTAQFFTQQSLQSYVVGGSVRDLLLQTPTITDWDIATSGNFTQVARHLANHLGGFYAPMHDKASRVVIKHEGQETVLDIVPIQGGSIEADLHTRDFTLNAIATPLVDAIHHLLAHKPLPLIDPLHGAQHLAAGTLSAVNDGVFQHDPLRLLRAVRFLTRYNLTLDPHTQQMISRDASLLFQAAAERIREELYTLLRSDGATDRLRLLDKLGLFAVLFPELEAARGMPQPSLHHWDVFQHSLETVTGLERLTSTLCLSPDALRSSPLAPQTDLLVTLQQLLQESEQTGIFSFTTLTAPATRLGALLHDIGKPPTYAVDANNHITFYHHPQVGISLAQRVMQRLHASTQDRRLVQQLVAHHMRPGQLSNDMITPRAIRRYFVDLGPTGIMVALISLADHLAMRGPQPLTEHWQRHLTTVTLLLTRYIRERATILPPRLIQADELIRKFHLTPGPIIGQLLESIAEAQTDGTIRSKEEAFWLAEEKLQHLL